MDRKVVGLIGLAGSWWHDRKERKERALRRKLKDRHGRRPECLEETPGLLRRLFNAREAQLEAIRALSVGAQDWHPDLLSRLAEDYRERTLVVVDAQTQFVAGGGEEWFLEMEALISRAVRRGWPIIFLEFEGEFGDTVERLLRLVEGYERAVRVSKGQWSGVGEVSRTCREQGFGTGIFQLCGAFTDQCVQATARDLSLNFRPCLVEVVVKACAAYNELATPPEPYDWFSFPMGENIELVHGARISATAD